MFWFAASHNIDYVFENPADAAEVNINSLINFFEIFKNVDSFYFSSTDCVYGESDYGVALEEESPLNPVNEYGKQKIEGEKIVLQNGGNVFRLPYMIGPSLIGKSHFYDYIRSNLMNSEKTEMIDGMVRSVISYKTASQLIYELSVTECIPSVINVCSDEALSKFQVGCRLAETFNADQSLIAKISEADGRKFFKDKRASRTVLSNALLKSVLGKKSIVWECE